MAILQSINFTHKTKKIKVLWLYTHIVLFEMSKSIERQVCCCCLAEKLCLERYIGRKVQENIMESNLQCYHQHYCSINPHLVLPLYPTSMDKIKDKTFARFRHEHTIEEERSLHFQSAIVDKHLH